MLPESFTRRVMAELGPEEEGRALCEGLVSGKVPGRCPRPSVCTRSAPAAGTEPRRFPGRRQDVTVEERPSRGRFTLDSGFHAGAYYVQEASSQFLAHVLAGEEVAGKRILDLCAAPGGKTTLYASLAGSDGLVVANEVNRQRAAVLADNVRKWGLGNVAVTCCEPRTVCDSKDGSTSWRWMPPVPARGCSAKHPGTGRVEREQCAKICAARQEEILREAWKTLRPGGLLIYSTCTFNRLENEGSLEGLLAEAGEEIVESTAVDCPPAWGVVCGRVGPFRTFRFYPHRTRGEGFFAAVARKVSDGGSRVRVPSPADHFRVCRTQGVCGTVPLGRRTRADALCGGGGCLLCVLRIAVRGSENAGRIAARDRLGRCDAPSRSGSSPMMRCDVLRIPSRAVPVAELSEEEALRVRASRRRRLRLSPRG